MSIDITQYSQYVYKLAPHIGSDTLDISNEKLYNLIEEP